MKTIQFKTNLQCGGCVSAVTPLLNKIEQINSWDVDTQKPDKILTVTSETSPEAEVISVLRSAGYQAEQI